MWISIYIQYKKYRYITVTVNTWNATLVHSSDSISIKEQGMTWSSQREGYTHNWSVGLTLLDRCTGIPTTTTMQIITAAIHRTYVI